MRFPETYIDQSYKNFLSFCSGIPDLVRESLSSNSIVTGTTIIALMSRDRKRGVIASDGRVAAGTESFSEKFKKIFDCRSGFIGAAGELGLIQSTLPVFRADLSHICDSRDEPMTASGSARRLFSYYRALISYGTPAPLALLMLFWDVNDKICHLYGLEGGSLLSRPVSATIGSGSALIKLEVEAFDSSDNISADELVQSVRALLRKAAGKDMATNTVMFYGLIDEGEFYFQEEGL